MAASGDRRPRLHVAIRRPDAVGRASRPRPRPTLGRCSTSASPRPYRASQHPFERSRHDREGHRMTGRAPSRARPRLRANRRSWTLSTRASLSVSGSTSSMCSRAQSTARAAIGSMMSVAPGQPDIRTMLAATSRAPSGDRSDAARAQASRCATSSASGGSRGAGWPRRISSAATAANQPSRSTGDHSPREDGASTAGADAGESNVDQISAHAPTSGSRRGNPGMSPNHDSPRGR